VSALGEALLAPALLPRGALQHMALLAAREFQLRIPFRSAAQLASGQTGAGGLFKYALTPHRVASAFATRPACTALGVACCMGVSSLSVCLSTSRLPDMLFACVLNVFHVITASPCHYVRSITFLDDELLIGRAFGGVFMLQRAPMPETDMRDDI
jgi:hypothetical protein